MKKTIENEEIIKDVLARVDKCVRDVDANKNTEAFALLELMRVALTQNNLADEVVLIKSVELEGLAGHEPMVFTKWYLRQKDRFGG